MISKNSVGKKFLITTDGWFVAPDGEQYKAVWGTLKGIHSSEDTLGIKTNARSTNWYVAIGNMVIAGCQMHYIIQTDEYMHKRAEHKIEHQGSYIINEGSFLVYNADVEEK